MVKEKFGAPVSTPETSKEDFSAFWERRVSMMREQHETSGIEEWPYHKVTDQEREKVYSKLHSEGTYRVFDINQRSLEYHALSPEFATELEGREFYFTHPFYIDNTRPAVIGFIEDDDHNYVARPFYRSNSQGLWRYMPDFFSKAEGRLSHMGKGWNEQEEEALNLPIELQNVLHNISENTHTFRFDESRKQMFMSTSHQRPDYYEDDRENPANSFYFEVNHVKRMRYGDGLSHSNLHEYIPPELLKVHGRHAPNFKNSYMSYETKMPMYGDVTVDCYKSFDQKLKYVFYRDEENRACLSTIETNAPLTSHGLRSTWIDGGRFVLPIYEYRSQLIGPYDFFDARSYEKFPTHPSPEYDRYADTFPNYLSKAPIIQDYLNSQSANQMVE